MRTTITYEEIYAQMAEEFERLAGFAPDRASDIAIRMKVLASQIYGLTTYAQWLKRQMFPQTATGEELEKHAYTRGLLRKGAIAAKGTLVFTLSEALWYDLVVELGTVCATDFPQVRVVTTQQGVIAAGELSVRVDARAEAPGAQGNLLQGKVREIVTPVPAALMVSNDAPFAGGADAEGDEELRKRLLQRYYPLPNGVNSAFYLNSALEYDGVACAAVEPRKNGRGTVAVTIAGAGATAPGPLAERIEQDLAVKKEINVDVTVTPAAEKAVPVEITVQPKAGYTLEEVAQAVKEETAGWFRSKKIGQPVYRASLGDCIFHVDGVENYALLSPSADLSVGKDEIAVCGAVTVRAMEAG